MNKALKHAYLNTMGIQSWSLKSALDNETNESEMVQDHKIVQPDKEPKATLSPLSAIPVQDAIEQETIEQKIPDQKSNIPPPLIVSTSAENCEQELAQKITLCKKCPTRQSRLHALVGQGNNKASLFIISSAPNVDEDRAGHYLIGQSESLFHTMLGSLELHDSYYFSGLIKCYSMVSFLVSTEELENCTPYLHAQIEQLKPSVLLVLGAFEAQSVLGSKESFNKLRGKVHTIGINNKDYSVVVSYHPSYLLRNPLYKKDSLNDLLMLKNLLQ